MRVLVAGAGIAGLTTALVFRRMGHDVHVLERAAQFSEVGAGIQIGPNGARLLHQLGLESVLKKVATVPEYGVLRYGKSGHRIARFPLGSSSQRRYNYPYYHIYRADLIEVIRAALVGAENSGGSVEITFNSEVRVLEDQGGEPRLVTTEGDEYKADLIVGSDGLSSALRNYVVGRENPEYSGLVAWRGLVPLSELADHTEFQRPGIWTGKGRHIVTYPLDKRGMCNFVAVAPASASKLESWSVQSSEVEKDQLRQAFAGWNIVNQAIIDKLTTSNTWGLYTRQTPKVWYKKRVVLVGDSAHPMLPTMAQGAVMAIEDAYVLGGLLGTTSTENNESISGALSQYQNLREARVRLVHRQAQRNADHFHMRNRISSLVGNMSLQIMGRASETVLENKYAWIFGYDANQEV